MFAVEDVAGTHVCEDGPNNLSRRKESQQHERMRTHRREQCGWKCETHKPYRALGTPDLDIDVAKLGQRSNLAGRHLDPSARTCNEGTYNTDNTFDNSLLAKRNERRSRRADVGLKELKNEVVSSQRRVTGCRSGSTFLEFFQRQRRMQTQPKLPQQMFHEVHVRGALTARETYTGRHIHSSHTQHVSTTLPQVAVCEKHDREEDTSRYSHADLLELDPETSLHERLRDFTDTKSRLDGQLSNNLLSFGKDRIETYVSKFKAFSTTKADFNADRWRLEAEKCRIENKLHSIDRNKWYARLLYAVTEGVRQPTQTETEILRFFDDQVIPGRDMNKQQILTSLLKLPRDLLESPETSRILLFIKNECAVPQEAAQTFASTTNLNICSELLRSQKNGVSQSMVRGNNFC
mmetsp:Transcript_16744/g.57151  ORF Transcript_16744/g.57151 Transcript_16744/m.57151 type:complete len:406 (+) Transcript_16744:147-1364(+)